jgi:outer membrane protein assembly factor BamE (lipoprotein component of BamABCDE complex)
MNAKSRKYKSALVRSMIAVAGAAVLLSACAPRVANRGNNPDEEALSQIVAGESNRQDVAEIIGVPSVTSTFDSNEWYYVSQRSESEAWFKPEIKDRKVLVIRFDERGTVKEMETMTLADGYQVAPVERVTPTAGNEITFLGQIFGNLGRFGKNAPK